jgi:hypothetical protein
VPTYLVERYAPAAAEPRPIEAWAAPGAGQEGPDGGIRHVLSTLIPHDELLWSLFEAPSEQAIAAALAARGIPYIRIVEAVLQGARDEVLQVEILQER